ncbi:TPA: HEPN domain-containing protein [Serratia marcescens]
MERTILLRTKDAVETCEGHLDASSSWNTEIESFLTQHILIVMCAEIQQEIYSILESRAHVSGDLELKDFAVASGKRILRSVGKKDLANFVGLFGSRAKGYLNDNIEDHEVTLYNNAVTKRHDVAHNSGTNITFRELKDILRSADKLIAEIEKAIAFQAV